MKHWTVGQEKNLRSFDSYLFCRIRLGMESRAVSTSVAKNSLLVAPSPSWSGKLHRLHLGLESRAVSALVWAVSTLIAKVATSITVAKK